MTSIERFRPLSSYGWGAAGTYAKPPVTKKKRLSPTPAAPVATDPLGSLLDDILRGPDFSGITQYTPEQLGAMAKQTVAEQLKPYEDMKADELARSKSMFEAQSQNATKFSEAMVNILQGGLTGEAGMAFAKENFGGSYLGAMAAQQGAQLIMGITQDWQERDFEIGDKYAEILARRPELEEQVRQQLLEGVGEQQESVLEDYKWKMDFYAWFKKNVVGEQATTDPMKAPPTRNFSDGTTRVWNGKSWVAVTKKGSAPVSPSQMNTYTTTANRIYNEAIKAGAKRWKAVDAARRYLADNGVNSKAWKPYGPGTPPERTDTTRAPTVRKFPDGSMRQWTGSKWAIIQPAPPPEVAQRDLPEWKKDPLGYWNSMRSEAFDDAAALAPNPGSPEQPSWAKGAGAAAGALTFDQAYKRLWTKYQILIRQGYTRKNVQTMLRNALRSAGF